MDHSTGSSMMMVFTNAQATPLYSNSWTPQSSGAYAGTCIFLILLAVTLRLLFAAKAVLEQRWRAKARDRRYVVVQGQSTEAARVNNNSDAKDGSLITANGLEEKVKVVQNTAKPVIPFRLSIDIPRAGTTTLIAGVSYLL